MTDLISHCSTQYVTPGRRPSLPAAIRRVSTFLIPKNQEVKQENESATKTPRRRPSRLIVLQPNEHYFDDTHILSLNSLPKPLHIDAIEFFAPAHSFLVIPPDGQTAEAPVETLGHLAEKWGCGLRVLADGRINTPHTISFNQTFRFSLARLLSARLASRVWHRGCLQ